MLHRSLLRKLIPPPCTSNDFYHALKAYVTTSLSENPTDSCKKRCVPSTHPCLGGWIATTAKVILGIQHILPVPKHAYSLLEWFFCTMAPNQKQLHCSDWLIRSSWLTRTKKRSLPIPPWLSFPPSVFTEMEGCSPNPSRWPCCLVSISNLTSRH